MPTPPLTAGLGGLGTELRYRDKEDFANVAAVSSLQLVEGALPFYSSPSAHLAMGSLICSVAP
jgi:hypothetical protein